MSATPTRSVDSFGWPPPAPPKLRNAAEIGREIGLGRDQSGTYLRLLEQGVTAQRLAPTDPAGAARFGALLETFVVTEVVKQLGWSSTVARPFHYRTADGVEVDLVLEADDGRVAAIEIKAGSTLTTAATRGLAHLRDRLGDRFIAGFVLNTGSQAQRVGDRVSVALVDQLWHAEQNSTSRQRERGGSEQRWTTMDNRIGADRRHPWEHDVPVRDEVDDTDMTAAEFRAARHRGAPTQVVRSREEFDAHSRQGGATFEVYEDRTGKFRFRLRSSTGQVVATSVPTASLRARRSSSRTEHHRWCGPRRTSAVSMELANGAAPQPDETCRGRLPVYDDADTGRPDLTVSAPVTPSRAPHLT
ncbi:MAG: DUF4143 domain-containing protein [Pseudonocardiaceae bacterium]